MKDRTIVVIGGTSGIGLALCRMLTESGATVFVGSRTAMEGDKLPGAEYFSWDALEGEVPLEIFPSTVQGLVYCPGTIRLRPISRLTDDDFLKDFNINLLGAVRATRSLLTRMKKSPSGGSIVLFSTVAVQTGMPFHASVASSKGAVEGLTRALAAELAPRIRVNAIAPSLTDTPLAAQLLSSEDKRKAAADRHPMKTIGSPEQLAHTAAYLLDPRSGWITGQILQVDGGMSAMRTFR